MVRLNLRKGVEKEVGDALKTRATAMLVKYGITEGTVAKGAGCYRQPGTGRSFETYYVLSLKDAPESCPVRRYVAYCDGDSLRIDATLRAGFTAADLEEIMT